MTKIEWTNETWNFQGGCTPVSEGCLHCAAARSAELCTIRGCKKYTGLTKNGKWTGELRFFPEELEKPLHWKKPRMIFPAFMSDLFHESVPFEWIRKIFIMMYSTGKHTYQLLTKRPQRALEFWKWFAKNNNLWLGVTCENQKTANERIPILLQIPAAVRFLSLEPLLEDIGKILLQSCREDDTGLDEYGRHIDWVIVGCESGPKRRPCKIEWVRSIVEQCKAANVPVFVKQLSINGKVEHDINKFPEDLRFREYPK